MTTDAGDTTGESAATQDRRWLPADRAPVVLEALVLAADDLDRRIGEPSVYRTLDKDVDHLRARATTLRQIADEPSALWGIEFPARSRY